MEFEILDLIGGFEPLTAKDGLTIKKAIFNHGGAEQKQVMAALNDLDDLMLKRFYLRKDGAKKGFINSASPLSELDIEFGNQVGEAIMIISTKWAEYALSFLGKSPNYQK